MMSLTVTKAYPRQTQSGPLTQRELIGKHIGLRDLRQPLVGVEKMHNPPRKAPVEPLNLLSHLYLLRHLYPLRIRKVPLNMTIMLKWCLVKPREKTLLQGLLDSPKKMQRLLQPSKMRLPQMSLPGLLQPKMRLPKMSLPGLLKPKMRLPQMILKKRLRKRLTKSLKKRLRKKRLGKKRLTKRLKKNLRKKQTMKSMQTMTQMTIWTNLRQM
jgi:hypothetical protein